jgi:hypothetical protein
MRFMSGASAVAAVDELHYDGKTDKTDVQGAGNKCGFLALLESGASMKFTAFLHKKLVDLLNDRRIVVWYDAEGISKRSPPFNAPNCEVLSPKNRFSRPAAGPTRSTG